MTPLLNLKDAARLLGVSFWTVAVKRSWNRSDNQTCSRANSV
jgi:hypothetical protein